METHETIKPFRQNLTHTSGEDQPAATFWLNNKNVLRWKRDELSQVEGRLAFNFFFCLTVRET